VKRAVLVVLALAVAAGLALVLLAPSRERDAAATPAVRELRSSAGSPAESIEASSAARQVDEDAQRSARPVSSAPSPTPTESAPAVYRVEFTNAEGGEPPGARVELSASLDGERLRPSFDARTGLFEFRGLRSGLWRLEARTPGFQDFAANVRIEAQASSEDRFKLWPVNWIVVRVRTHDGGTIDSLAQRLGMETADVFEHGFAVWRSDEPPADELAPPMTAPQRSEQGVELASPHYERHRRDPREVARVRRAPRGSTWIALAFHARFLGWGQALASDGAVEFELALEDVTEQFGSLALCVVDEASGAPRFDAQVRLSAETSGLRRADSDRPVTDPQGCVSVRPLVPDEYDLVVEAPGCAAHHQRIALAAGQRLDLGAIALRLAPPLEIAVVDEALAPVRAIVQVGAWREGAWLDDCVTPHASSTDDNGHTTIPTPGVKSVLCARRLVYGPDGRPTVQVTPTAVALFDPATSRGELRLVLAPAYEIQLELAREHESAAMLLVVDSTGVAIARTSRWTPSPRFELPSGAHQARVLDAVGAELARYEFVVPRGGSERAIRLE